MPGQQAEAASVSGLVADFCGERYVVSPERGLSIGREADISVDDNPFLHRKLVELVWDAGFWWIVNVGSRLSITVTGEAGTLQAWVAPGSRLPMVLPSAAILFTAGETTYEVLLECDAPAFDVAEPENAHDEGDYTLGAVSLTPSQTLLVLALAEATLSRGGTGSSDIPSNASAAKRLDWPLTTFNRKLDNVCDKFSRAGVKGLRGRPGELATNRRARLVEYAVAARIVRPEDLHLLDHDASQVQA